MKEVVKSNGLTIEKNITWNLSELKENIDFYGWCSHADSDDNTTLVKFVKNNCPTTENIVELARKIYVLSDVNNCHSFDDIMNIIANECINIEIHTHFYS